ncbi:MAG: family NAD(P)-dependent oxidoreductase, partial [Ramlibacter sp.]|nr:family NAD(P)-dependent oxidoreductase [Ramlibacter sp.]
RCANPPYGLTCRVGSRSDPTRCGQPELRIIPAFNFIERQTIMDMGIKGRWALVGGASKGLGYGCAQALAREGAHVVMVARGAEALQAAAAKLRADGQVPAGTQLEPIAADITTTEGRAKVFAFRKDFDIVVTNAGGPPPGDFRDWDREAWIKAVDANMLTPIELIKATVDGMAARGFGRIVNITSSSVKAPIDILGLSNGARSGLTGFVAGVARTSKLAGANVTINNLLPGAFDTDRLKATMEGGAKKSGKSIDEVREQRMKTIPALRFGNADEFGAACAFLCSVHAGYVTGQNVLIDGGAYPGTY